MESSVHIHWPGHIPGRFYFGMSRSVPGAPLPGSRGDSQSADLIESYGVDRVTIRWGMWDRLIDRIAADHAAHRLPWISIRPPARGVEGWREIATGRHDDSIYQLGRRMVEAMSLPAIVTFDDDPTDAAESDGQFWAQAYSRFHDNLAAATGLRLLAEAPIISDWLFNPANPRQDPANWLTPDVLDRSSLLGVNVLENASGESFERRLPRILDWLDSRGFAHLMIGVAQCGRTEYAPAYVSPEEWLNDSLAWVARHTDRVTLVCYSSVGEWQGVYWPPAELGCQDARMTGWASRAVINT